MTATDLDRHQRYADRGSRRIAITGATGFVGTALTSYLAEAGHEVLRISRRQPQDARDVQWDPTRGLLDPRRLEGVDAVVHLAGESLAERWTPERRRRIRDSRVEGTALLARTIAALHRPPRVLVSASAVGFYGNTGDVAVDEMSAQGTGFLASVTQEWEAAAEPARDAGVRVVHPRFGVVLNPAGGMLGRVLLPFRLGVGGTLGSGRQWVSWIARDDLLGALEFMLFEETLLGPVNAVSPHPVRNAELTRTLGRVLGRPAVVPVPGAALRLLFGEMADEALLAGQRVLPTILLTSGFRFRHPMLEEALRFELGEGGGRSGQGGGERPAGAGTSGSA